MNRDKPTNMRKSITLKCEMLIDTKVLLGCKLELQRQITMPPVMGSGMLEPYEAKVSCTVLKGLGAGNGLRLLDRTEIESTNIVL